ncbi:hypothetical protein EWF20_06140 [Sulfolobus sp. S-194]|uniref:M48 family metalloprotease n=1 Tax=Sulfolobus sp. S-194 TaxID=2512240 RepID=UPI001436FF9A|nr:M48 family metalloprotease [Sulfolobus sp. S-194]QIW23778.1 hypothetical protein EWF20_06140 [Sulfolobus sp. S-194]
MVNPVIRAIRKMFYFFMSLILADILLAIVTETAAKGNPYLYPIFTKVTLALSEFLIGAIVVSFAILFIKYRKIIVPSVREVVYNKQEDIIYQPELISLKTRLITIFTIALSAFTMILLGLAPYTPKGFIIDTITPFIISILINGLVFPRIKPFKYIKPGEIKIVTINTRTPGATAEVLTLSHNPFSKRLIIINNTLPSNIIKTIEAHEIEHAKEHHALIKSIFNNLNYSLFFTTVELISIFIFAEVHPHHVSFTVNAGFVVKDLLFFVGLIFVYLLFLRVAESRADAAAFRASGSEAYNHMITLIRMFRENSRRVDLRRVEVFPFSFRVSSFLDRVVHTSSREALRTGDALSSLAQWEIPAVFAFFGSIIEVLRLSSVNLVIFAFPLFFVGMFVVIVLVGLVFLPLTRSYGGTQKGRMNFSFLVSGLYLITDVITLTVIYNFYLALLVLVSGLVLSFLIQKSFLSDMRTAVKTFLITFAVYETINVSLFLIFLGSHLGVF